MFNSIIIASVNAYTQGTPDKNGKAPIILNIVSGECPNRNVLSGTVAESLGIETGKTYMFSVREVEANEYGRQFVYGLLSELRGIEILQASKELGPAKVFSVDSKTEQTNAALEKSFHEANK